MVYGHMESGHMDYWHMLFGHTHNKGIYTKKIRAVNTGGPGSRLKEQTKVK